MKRRVLSILLATIASATSACPSLHAGAADIVHIEPREKDNFRVASFGLRIPGKVKKPRYILVLLPGFNGNGGGLLEHRLWFEFAEETSAAVIACTFKSLDPKKDNFVHYAAAQHGSGAALESAIEQLGTKSSPNRLKHLPLLIYGHSAGGQFAYGFSCHNPKRLIGFAATKGGYYFPEPVEGTYEVPGLLISGEKDLARRRTAIHVLFESHRENGAPWCWLEDTQGHSQADSLSVVIPYFKGLLQLRLEEGSETLLDIPRHSGVTVDLVNRGILHEGTACVGDGNITRSGFLPSEVVFKAWAQLDIGERKYAEKSDTGDGT